MSVENTIQKLLERAVPKAAGQEGRIAQGSSNIDHQGQADVEVLGTNKVGVAASANAGGAAPLPGSNQGGEKGLVKQGASDLSSEGQEDEEDLSGDDTSQNAPGVAASAKAGSAAPLPGSNSGGEMTPVLQGSSKLPTPGQNEEADAAFAAAMTEAGIPAEAQAKLKEAFEAAVTARVEAEIEAASDTLAEAVQELADANSQELYASVNEYLNYAVETWMEQNALAIETGLRTEIVESFIDGLKTLFVEHAIEVPEESYDPLVAATAKVEELEAKLNESMAAVVKLTESTRTLERRQIVERATKDMVATDAEKFSKLVEDVEFESVEAYTEKIDQMKVRYFAKDTSGSKPTLTEASTVVDAAPDETITSYVKALSKTAKR